MVQVWRRRLVPGARDFDWCAVWSASPLPYREGPPPVIVNTAGTAFPLKVSPLGPTQFYNAGVRFVLTVPAGTPVGEYALRVYGVNAGLITVAATPNPLTVIKDQTFESTQLEVKKPDTLYLRCRFQRTAVFASAGLFMDCEWSGLAAPGDGSSQHAFSTWGTSGPLAIVGGRFTGTDRGPVLNVRSADVAGAMFSRITVTECGSVDGGNEVLCIEDGDDSRDAFAVRECVFEGWRVYNCEGDATLFYAPVVNCLFQNLVMDGSNLHFMSNVGTQRGNLIEGCEFRNAGITLGNGATSNTITRCGFLNSTAVRRGNKFWGSRDIYDPINNQYNPVRVFANGPDFRGNVVQECTFR